ncbi:MAG: hypothetical protein J7L53_04365 [Deltaproteobacteria bacterium]|nr:hypothetical protein [Deltaproteobacteria bacterium]
MQVTMAIPSYWARESKVGWRKGDAIYDHPTPLDSEGTLLRAIQSVEGLKDKDFQLIIIAVATAEDIETKVENKVINIIKSVSPAIGVEVLLFGHSHLMQIHDLLISDGKKEYASLLKLQGYSNIRNLCMFIPHILGSEVALLIDDDEVFEDPSFISKAKEFIGKSIKERDVNAVAGYYLQPDGDYHLKKTLHPWMKYWDQYDRMNEAFDKIIGTEPRLKDTPFVFGGNMVIHRDLFTVVPFDPNVPRGEDIDFLINAKMFGFTFFLDNQLSIKHLPPPKANPTWVQLREDIYRFAYERAKIEHQRQIRGMTRVYPEDFDPYPGCFLKRDLEKKIEKSCKVLSEEYLAQGDRKGSEEALNNIALAKTDAVPKYDPFQRLCELQKRWQELMEYTSKSEVLSSIKKIIESGGKK